MSLAKTKPVRGKAERRRVCVCNTKLHVHSEMTGQHWIARHVGEATGELSGIKWRVRNPPMRERHLAMTVKQKGAKRPKNRKKYHVSKFQAWT